MDSIARKRIETREHKKYMSLHANGYGSTGYQKHISEYVRWSTEPDYKILDLGCGCGVAVAYLLQNKRLVFGVDITLVGVKSKLSKANFSRVFTEANLWSLPFKDDEFDYTFSADVLEHIPPALVKDAIAEIFRVTSKQTLHVVSIQPSNNKKIKLHLTVKPLEWWKDIFSKHNSKGINYIVTDCPEFLKLHERKKEEMKREVRCTCGRLLDYKEKLVRHLRIHEGDARHLPDLSHPDTKLSFC